MLKTLKRPLSDLAMKTRLAMFGNNHSVRTNLRYGSYHREAVRKWRRPQPASPEAVAAAAKFAELGWAVLPPALDEQTSLEIGRRVDQMFDSGEDVVKVSNGLLRLADGVERMPEIIKYASGFVEEVIESFFHSHFKIYNVSMYRTVPNPDVPESSFLWHFDNVPDEEIKLMIYFDNVYEDTGAFRFKSREYSQNLRKDGFWHRKYYHKVAGRIDDTASTVCVEGKPGTSILFQNGRVAHKATAPRRLHRDIATFVIIPSTIPWREHYARNRHLLSTNAGLCKNPWTDEPENIGYRY